MAVKYVCTGAILRCSFGTCTSKLIATPKRVSLTGEDQANIEDYVSLKNIQPFGKCRSLAYPPTAEATARHHGRLTPMPCVPSTCLRWTAVDPYSLICGSPALLKGATLYCSYGGTISIINPGQDLEIKGMSGLKPELIRNKDKQEGTVTGFASTLKGHVSYSYPEQKKFEQNLPVHNFSELTEFSDFRDEHFNPTLSLESTNPLLRLTYRRTFEQSHQSNCLPEFSEILPEVVNLYRGLGERDLEDIADAAAQIIQHETNTAFRIRRAQVHDSDQLKNEVIVRKENKRKTVFQYIGMKPSIDEKGETFFQETTSIQIIKKDDDPNLYHVFYRNSFITNKEDAKADKMAPALVFRKVRKSRNPDWHFMDARVIHFPKSTAPNGLYSGEAIIKLDENDLAHYDYYVGMFVGDEQSGGVFKMRFVKLNF